MYKRRCRWRIIGSRIDCCRRHCAVQGILLFRSFRTIVRSRETSVSGGHQRVETTTEQMTIYKHKNMVSPIQGDLQHFDDRRRYQQSARPAECRDQTKISKRTILGTTREAVSRPQKQKLNGKINPGRQGQSTKSQYRGTSETESEMRRL